MLLDENGEPCSTEEQFNNILSTNESLVFDLSKIVSLDEDSKKLGNFNNLLSNLTANNNLKFCQISGSGDSDNAVADGLFISAISEKLARRSSISLTLKKLGNIHDTYLEQLLFECKDQDNNAVSDISSASSVTLKYNVHLDSYSFDLTSSLNAFVLKGGSTTLNAHSITIDTINFNNVVFSDIASCKITLIAWQRLILNNSDLVKVDNIDTSGFNEAIQGLDMTVEAEAETLGLFKFLVTGQREADYGNDIEFRSRSCDIIFGAFLILDLANNSIPEEEAQVSEEDISEGVG